MPTFSGLYRTILTTRDVWRIIQLRNAQTAQTIKFRNGVEVTTTYLPYTLLRDWFWNLQKQGYKIKKTDTGCVVKKGNFIYQTKYPVTARPLFEFLLKLNSQNWTIKQTQTQYNLYKNGAVYTVEQTGDDLFEVTSEKIHFVGPIESCRAYFDECLEGKLYENIYQGKVVLDVGGFCGETAAFFSSQGAEKIIIYEPVPEHQALIEENIRLNHINAELHEAGIGERDGKQVISYDRLDIGFGSLATGQKQTSIKIKNVSEVLMESGADIAKIDCEGAETSLIGVDPAILRLIDYYIVETHTKEIQALVAKKFLESGFSEVRKPVTLMDGISVLYFEKSTNSSKGKAV
jgi:FkbM family methyltransferase